ncbi:phosphoglycerate kinase, partial [Candidatus Pelagibacter sp.]|nr:phosphoglycerate kinase [Candidatus Pelagibacter sp.]
MRSIIHEKNLRNKKILLRLDLNVPLKKNKITDTTRINKILPTLNFLIKQKAKIIILSHVGRPKGKV